MGLVDQDIRFTFHLHFDWLEQQRRVSLAKQALLPIRKSGDSEIASEFLYTSFIFVDPRSQSSIESWIIQSESIQTYWTSKSRANWIASWKFFGSSDVGILSNMLSRSCSFNVKIGRKPSSDLKQYTECLGQDRYPLLIEFGV